jgi:hypothetical protein
MKLLFDQGTPVPLRNHLPRHTVETAHERGWGDLKNGDLLARAEAEGFDALIRSHVGRARENGVTLEELVETITHLAFYSGWPNAVTAIGVARELFEKK